MAQRHVTVAPERTHPTVPFSKGRAISRLEELWEGYFTNPDQDCPFCPYLDGRPHGMLSSSTPASG